MKLLALSAIWALLAAPAVGESHATGDATAGEAAFARQCVSCHVVVNEAGETLAGRKAKTGPNLYGVTERVLGTFPDFRYSPSLVKAGEAGIVWSEENFIAYVKDPTLWLRKTLDDPKARSKMSFKVRKEEDALNLYAFLAAIGTKTAMDDVAEPEEKKAAAPGIPVSYASEQADRGAKKYEKECEECHGDDLKGGLNGGAPLRGLNFESKYADGAPASMLFVFTSTLMPPNSPGRFSPNIYADLVAYILKRNGIQPGAPLPSDIDALDKMIVNK